MRPDHRFLWLCIATTCAALTAVAMAAPPILRMIFALPMAFVLPGAALLRNLELRFTPSAQAPLVVGISMAITVLSGLVLNRIGGLNPLGWTAWLGGGSILGAVAAVWSRDVGVLSQPRPKVRIRHGVMLAASAAVLVLTMQQTSRNIAAYHPFPHTNFWMQRMAPSDVYLIGIQNDEGRPESYAVQLMVDRRITGEWTDLILAPGKSITFPVMLQAGASAQAWLYRPEQPNAIYRRLAIAGVARNDAPHLADAADTQ